MSMNRMWWMEAASMEVTTELRWLDNVTASIIHQLRVTSYITLNCEGGGGEWVEQETYVPRFANLQSFILEVSVGRSVGVSVSQSRLFFRAPSTTPTQPHTKY